MKIERIIGMTRDIGKPVKWDEATMGPCASLPVRDEVIGNANCMISAHSPTPEDLTKLAAGEPLLLGIYGTVHPVVFMTVGYSPEYKEAFKEEFAALRTDMRSPISITDDMVKKAGDYLLNTPEQSIYTAARQVLQTAFADFFANCANNSTSAKNAQVSDDVPCEAPDEPWQLLFTDEDKPSPFVATEGDVVCIPDPNHEQPDRWDYKNFRRIAATPDLLKNLKRMVDHFGGWVRDRGDEATAETWAALHCAEGAIKKAEGHGVGRSDHDAD